jgi:hypothetical protein
VSTSIEKLGEVVVGFGVALFLRALVRCVARVPEGLSGIDAEERIAIEAPVVTAGGRPGCGRDRGLAEDAVEEGRRIVTGQGLQVDAHTGEERGRRRRREEPRVTAHEAARRRALDLRLDARALLRRQGRRVLVLELGGERVRRAPQVLDEAPRRRVARDQPLDLRALALVELAQHERREPRIFPVEGVLHDAISSSTSPDIRSRRDLSPTWTR